MHSFRTNAVDEDHSPQHTRVTLHETNMKILIIFGKYYKLQQRQKQDESISNIHDFKI